MDVEGIVVSTSISLRWLLFPSLQQLRVVQALESPRCPMASVSSKPSIPVVVRWQHIHDIGGCAAKASRKNKGKLSTEECVVGDENPTAN